MRHFATVILFLLPCLVLAQTKRGGYFSRIDDPYCTYRPNNGVPTESQLVSYSAGKGIKTTIAVVCEYSMNASQQPYKIIYPQKAAYLKTLQAAGHTLATHSPNHSTCYYISHIDSLSAEDQALVQNGYNRSQGVDTIIINSGYSAKSTGYYRHLNDDHFTLFAMRKLVDSDNALDSCWYNLILPPRSVFIGIFPGEAGLTKLLDESERRFVASGLNPPVMFIHPGQENSPMFKDSACLQLGYVSTTSGSHVVTFHIKKWLSSALPSQKYDPISWANCININNVNYTISDASSVSGDTVWTVTLPAYTGDGSNKRARLLPVNSGDWMWYVDANTMEKVARDRGWKTSAVYDMGCQWRSIGWNPSEGNKDLFRYAQQWNQGDINTQYAKTVITRLCEAVARHTFLSGDDHQYYASDQYNTFTARIDSLFNFINDKHIRLWSNYMLGDSLWAITPDPAENILPSFDTDLNADGLMDGWKLNTSTWTTGSNGSGDATYCTLNSTGVYCDNLWGVEKGLNVLSLFARQNTGTVVSITIEEYSIVMNSGILIGTTTKTLSLPSNWNQVNTYFNIREKTDYIKITIASPSGTVDVAKPMMYKK